jgi:16S rRNA (uracil1498-N3)-methyltransferase
VDWLLGAKKINMRRYWIEKKFITDTSAQIEGELFHHIFDVCREEVGSRFELITAEGQAAFVIVKTLSKKMAHAEILEFRKIEALKYPHLHLVLSIPRFNVFDAVIEKAVELGAHTIHPVLSDFSFIKNATSLPMQKHQRWDKIIRSATQQCGRGELMQISPLKSLKHFLHEMNPQQLKMCLFAYEGVPAKELKAELAQMQMHLKNGAKDIWFFIGSEGGFSTEEVNNFKHLGISALSLGAQVLRVETACMAMISVLKYEFGLM